MLRLFYDRIILARPGFVVAALLLALVFFAFEARKLEIDASAETLILENDADLRFTREMNKRYGSSDTLVISYIPRNDLFSEATLSNLTRLRDELTALEGVASVTSILDVPLLESPRQPIKELVRNGTSLESPDADRQLARTEFQNSPIYRNLLVSPDLRMTALQINMPDDPVYQQLLQRRNELRSQVDSGKASAARQAEFVEVQARFKAHRDAARETQHDNITAIRAVMDQHRDHADLFLGGAGMIADDLVTFIKSDLAVFGLGVLALLALTLWLLFRQLRWVALPLLCSALSVIVTCGLLGAFSWEVTVISSNFISLQLIITMAVVIHLIVRYRELIRQDPEASQKQLVLETVLSMARPCLFAMLTTVAGFSSLILCDILPVINFGWMMSAGIAVSLLLTFLLFPALLMLFPKRLPAAPWLRFSLIRGIAAFTESFGPAILVCSALLLVGALIGTFRLTVENSFIDYFKDTTEIYQGMKVIDEQLGGTTPLEVLIDFDPVETSAAASADDEFDAFEDFDELEDEFEAEQSSAQYWFTEHRMEQVEAVHDYLDGLPQTGKVLSLGTMLKVGRRLNDGENLDNFQLALIYNELPEKYRRIILSPYVSVENNQARFALRVIDSDPELRRDELLRTIKTDLTQKLGIKEDKVHLAGLLLLYNNMLQSLFSSQILTLGTVIAVLMLMFLILFRSPLIAGIAIAPNLLSVGAVLGFMGWADIPLDMMTITIAAISVGIAVDDTIHYIHRFKKEYAVDHDYIAAMHRCHESIGYAMYYTSITVVMGFSILVLSNFIPSIYFGLLAGLAMVIALLSSLTLLPRLIIMFKPFGPNGGAGH